MSNEYSYVQVQQQWGAERRFVSERSERGWPPVHFSSQNNPGGEFETTPQVSGDFLDYDPGREDPNSMPGYRDAEFEIPLIMTHRTFLDYSYFTLKQKTRTQFIMMKLSSRLAVMVLGVSVDLSRCLPIILARAISCPRFCRSTYIL